jgi:hypothetical protein
VRGLSVRPAVSRAARPTRFAITTDAHSGRPIAPWLPKQTHRAPPLEFKVPRWAARPAVPSASSRRAAHVRCTMAAAETAVMGCQPSCWHHGLAALAAGLLVVAVRPRMFPTKAPVDAAYQFMGPAGPPPTDENHPGRGVGARRGARARRSESDWCQRARTYHDQGVDRHLELLPPRSRRARGG